MAKYIDKDALVAEIESLRCTTFTNFDEGVNCAVQTLLEIINTLEVKEMDEEPVSNDLEEAANDYAHDLVHDDVFETFIAGAQWHKEQMVLNDNNKEYHKVPSTTLKRLYMNEAKYELLKSDIMEGIVGDFEKGTTHSYLTIKIPMLLCPSNCAKGDKVKLIIVMEAKK